MNIFLLSLQFIECAVFHCDQHVVKMILESAQMLCTVVLLSGGVSQYRIAHQKHPCTLWALRSLSNWKWLRSLAFALNDEFRFRYDKNVDHKSIDVIKNLAEPNIPDLGLTPFAQAMPEQYKNEDPVVAYRSYYAGEKYIFATWKKRSIPPWYIEYRKALGGDAVKEVKNLLNSGPKRAKPKAKKDNKKETEESDMEDKEVKKVASKKSKARENAGVKLRNKSKDVDMVQVEESNKQRGKDLKNAKSHEEAKPTSAKKGTRAKSEEKFLENNRKKVKDQVSALIRKKSKPAKVIADNNSQPKFISHVKTRKMAQDEKNPKRNGTRNN